MSTPIHVRVDDDTLNFIDKLVANGRYKDRTDFAREAMQELKAQFTGEPTMRTLDGRVKIMEFSVGKLQRNVNRILEELKIEPLK